VKAGELVRTWQVYKRPPDWEYQTRFATDSRVVYMQSTTDPDNNESGILGNRPRHSIHYLEGIECRLSSKDVRLRR
jgi:hypothetical protein